MKRYYLNILFLLLLFVSCNNDKRFESVKFLLETNQTDKAMLILKHTNPAFKKSFEYNFYSGLALKNKNLSSYKREALNYFLEALRYNAKDYTNLLMISKMSVEVNDLKNAEFYALQAKANYSAPNIQNYEDDINFVLAIIYYLKNDWSKAFEYISETYLKFPQNKNVIVYKMLIESNCNHNNELKHIIKEIESIDELTDKTVIFFMMYLLQNKKFDKLISFTTKDFSYKSDLLKYYIRLFSACVYLSNQDFVAARKIIESTNDYEVDDPYYFRFRVNFYYKFLTEADNIKVYNSYIFYRFLFEKDPEFTDTAKEDLSVVEDYFKTDIFFNFLSQQKKSRL